MSKVLLLILVFGLIYWFYRKWLARRGTDGAAQTGTVPGMQEKMVTCAHCRLHVPENEAVAVAGRHYCSDEHRRLDGR